MGSVEESGLRRRPPLRQHRQFGGGLFALQMRQNSLDHRRFFNAGNDLDVPRAPLAGLDIDVEHPLEPLHPGHRLVALRRRLVQPIFPGRLTLSAPPTPFGWSYPHTKLAIRSKNPVKACQICAWLRHQDSKLRDEVQRFEYDMGGPVAVWCLQLAETMELIGCN